MLVCVIACVLADFNGAKLIELAKFAWRRAFDLLVQRARPHERWGNVHLQKRAIEYNKGGMNQCGIHEMLQ